MDDFVDGTPVREASDGTIINEKVGVKLAGADAGFVDFFARVVAVDGKEFEATLFTKIYGILQKLAFSGGPEDEPMTFFLNSFKGCYG